MIEGVTAPRGTSVAHATTTPTARFPFILFCQPFGPLNITAFFTFIIPAFHLFSETFRWRSQFHKIGFAFCCHFSKLSISETFRCWSRK
ncbi:hypothetical protein DXZ79_00045 [Yersinia rochesterensis]|uniref:Uncharacterized protein n=1 Tax=Yersinia rochesterensis TaxID=1604335 RepID=A0A8D4SQ88_9GAMM|nr:hypothetical protein DXZ79_00045 [Yersinia rochesterensis]